MQGRHVRQLLRVGVRTPRPVDVCLWVSIVAILLGPCSWAQSDEVNVTPQRQANRVAHGSREASSQDSAAKSLRVNVELVLVPVTDRMNRSIVDLEKRDFGIYEDNAQQQTATSVRKMRLSRSD